jgi:hypothetical protein
MEDVNIVQEEAQKLRERLRDERTVSTNEGSRSASKGRRSSDAAFGSIGEDFRADSGTISGDTKNARSSDRGSKVSSKRGRQDNGRSLDNGGGLADGDLEASRRTGLVRADPILELPKRGPGRPRKEEIIDKAVEIKKTIFKKRSPLSEKEAQEYKEPLMSAIQSYGEYADKYVRWRTEQPEMAEIWGDIMDFEAEALANIMIRRGMKSAHAAEAIRSMIAGEDYISVGVMLLPRIIRTTEEMKKIPAKPRKRRVARENSDQ